MKNQKNKNTGDVVNGDKIVNGPDETTVKGIVKATIEEAYNIPLKNERPYERKTNFVLTDCGRQQEKVKYCLACGAENPESNKFCKNCGNGKFVKTHDEYLRIKSEQEDKNRHEKDERKVQRKEQRNKKVAQGIKSFGSGIGKAAKCVGSGIGKAARCVGKGIGTSCTNLFNVDSIVGFAIFCVISVITAALGMFTFVYAYTRTIIVPSQESLIFTVTMIVFGCLMIYNFVYNLILYIKTHDDEVGLSILIGLIGLVVIGGICLIAGWFSGYMWQWTWVFVAFGGLGAIIALGVCLSEYCSGYTDITIVIFNYILALILGLCCCAATYIAQNKPDGFFENFCYYVNDDNTLSVSALEYEETVEFPDEINGIRVTTIIAPIDLGSSNNLKNVVIPEGIINIGKEAFKNCALETVVLPDSLISINEGAFCGCAKLTNVILGKSVNNIGDEAFKNCSQLSYVYLNDALEIIGYSAFENCYELNELFIPLSVSRIVDTSFDGCLNINFYCERESDPGYHFWTSPSWDKYWQNGRPVYWSQTRRS